MALKILRERRKASGLTQETLSADIGLSVSQISRIERGLRKLRLDDAARWAQRLGIKITDIPSELIADESTNLPELQLIEETLRAAAALGPRKWEEFEFHLAAELIQAFSLRWRSSGEAQAILRIRLELDIRRAFQRGNL